MNQKRTIMYAHGSAYNHGCEAIVRSTVDLLSLEKEKTLLFSNNIQGDLDYKLSDIVKVEPINETPVGRNSPQGIIYRACSHLYSDHEKMYYRFFGKKRYEYMYNQGEFALSIGGDNYCYPSAIEALCTRNYWLNKKGTKTILWGATLSETFMTPNVIDDLNRYSLICVRESYSLELLKKYSVKTNIVLSPDPAFALKPEETAWKKHRKDIIGVNISSFVFEYSENDMGLKNYITMINWILAETDFDIALIPHVVFPNTDNNDVLFAAKLKDYFLDEPRVFVVNDGYNCCQLKSLISKCRMFIGARTHSTIAAYSTGVPTLVVGYSEKSIGIAKDLFGTSDGYVCSVQNMEKETHLLNDFKNLLNNEQNIRSFLNDKIPEYVAGHKYCVDAAKDLLFK